jgi:hypothetical protein
MDTIPKQSEKEINTREKVVVMLTLFLIQMIHPWEYSHQYEKFWAEIKDAMKKS